ncbi:hypothetical protein J6590_009367 [Homalodisca vitripennis]|nr:hypothetical protein J6590_009367 [Homalodisca vitripennis]
MRLMALTLEVVHVVECGGETVACDTFHSPICHIHTSRCCTVSPGQPLHSSLEKLQPPERTHTVGFMVMVWAGNGIRRYVRGGEVEPTFSASASVGLHSPKTRVRPERRARRHYHYHGLYQ